MDNARTESQIEIQNRGNGSHYLSQVVNKFVDNLEQASREYQSFCMFVLPKNCDTDLL